MPTPTNIINKKQTIKRQALWNLGLEKKDILSAADLKLLKKELKDIVYVDGKLPNFIVSNSLEDNSSDELENPVTAPNDDEKHARNARNILKHIVRGIPLCKTDGESYINSPLYADEIIETLTTKRDSRLLDSFRAEMQKVLNNSFEYLQSGKLSSGSEKQYEIFQSNFLAAYPFMDPLQDEKVELPQKINGQWVKIPYKFKQLDISPKSGPFSWVLEDEDRIYAYALVSEQAGVVNHLLLMGSTYTAGQGRGFANLYNFKPRNSVGEGHDMTEVDAWLEQQKKNNRQVKVTGHSKGATMSMITAARHPDVIIQADCLNPTGLCSNTLARLTPAWDVLSQEQRPRINVYAQEGDPAFPLEKGFLEGTNIYRVIPNTDKAAMNFGPIATIQGVDISVPKIAMKAYEAHLHHFAGRSSVLMLKVNTQRENFSKRRELFNNVKYMVNLFRFPVEYADLFLRIMARKSKRSAEPVLTTLENNLPENVVYGVTTGINTLDTVVSTSTRIAVHATAIPLACALSSLKMEAELLINGPSPYSDEIPRQLIYGSMIAGGITIVSGAKAVNTGVKAAALLFSGIKNTAGWAVNQFNSASGDMVPGTKHLKMD